MFAHRLLLAAFLGLWLSGPGCDVCGDQATGRSQDSATSTWSTSTATSRTARYTQDGPESSELVESLTDSSDSLRLLAQWRGFLYIGGVNFIAQLNGSSLELVANLSTGPVLDSRQCHASGCSSTPKSSLVTTDNVNKVLVVDEEHEQLIWCGSVYQGACSLSPLSDIGSKPPQFIAEPIAANDNFSTTFAFIGPQSYNPWGQGNVLYVGTTFSPVGGDYRHDVPAISSRNLHDLKFAEHSFSKQSLLRIDVKYRDQFLVDYIYGFYTSTHIYFITVQKLSHSPGHEDRGHQTRLARLCINDANFDTYMETTLQCHFTPSESGLSPSSDGEKNRTFSYATAAHFHDQSPNRKDNPTLIVAFSRNSSSQDSILCNFDLQAIETTFEINIHECLNGTVKERNLEYISGPVHEGKCFESDTPGNIENYCEMGLKISGRHSIEAESKRFLNEVIVSLTSLGRRGQVVVYAGTQSGKVLQASIHSSAFVEVFRAKYAKPIRRLLFSNHEKFLFILQSQSLSRANLENRCNRLNLLSCDACLASKEFFCGWCTINSLCGVESSCQADNWLLSGVSQCITLDRIIPKALSASPPYEDIRLILKSSPIPSLSTTLSSFQSAVTSSSSNKAFLCLYTLKSDSSQLSAPATVHDKGFTCPNPLKLRPNWPVGNFTIQINFVQTGVTIVSSNMLVYNCSDFGSCSSCLESASKCSWCPLAHECTDATRGGRLDSECSIGTVDQVCPSVSVPTILVPHGIRHTIRIPFDHFPQIYERKNVNLFCLATIEGASMIVSAVIRANVVHCEPTIYAFNEEQPTLKEKLSVVTESNQVLVQLEMELYKCSILAQHDLSQDCSLCKSLSLRYDCNWCYSRCVNGDCEDQHPSRDICPAPILKTLVPTSGPIQGGTLIYFGGINFDVDVKKDRYSGNMLEMFLGEQPCLNVTVVNISTVACVSPPMDQAGSVRVRFGDAQSSYSNELRFNYLEVALSRAHPTKGTISGGTRISIQGRNIDAGQNSSVFLDDMRCPIVSRSRLFENELNEALIECETPQVPYPTTTRSLRVVIDAAVAEIPFEFEFAPNPTIQRIKPLKAYKHGGRSITFHGDGFWVLNRVQMSVLMNGNQSILSPPCSVVSNRYVECTSPRIVSTDVPAETIITAHVGLVDDGARAIQKLNSWEESIVQFVPNPKLVSWRNPIKLYPGDILVLEGEHLAQAAHKDDFLVLLSDHACNVTTLTDSHLACVPPSSVPESSTETVKLFSVEVVLLGQMNFTLGLVKLHLTDDEERSSFAQFDGLMSPEIVGAAGAALALLTFISVVFILILRHKSSEKEREYKRIQIQMDLLENNVRSECKQAFAELQTDMSDMSAVDISRSQVPLLDEFDSIDKFLQVRPTGNIPKQLRIPPNHNYESIILHFQSTLNNGFGLTQLVDMCEYQLDSDEQKAIANSLSKVLLCHMHLFAQLVRSRAFKIVDLMESGGSGEHVGTHGGVLSNQLCSNWLAICLQKYLRESIAPCLFTLQQAIRCQVEKGPVDMMTNLAKYSLSADGLLQTVNPYSHIICLVLQRDLEDAYEIKVLDCDSISQVKRKILDQVYKATPYSLRPSVQDVDLEWQCNEEAHIILQDVDLTSKQLTPVGERPGFRQSITLVNNLQHYGVGSKAVVSLVPKIQKKLTSSSPISKPHESASNPYQEHLSPISPTSPLIGRRAIPEVYLTRLLSTKGILSHFIDDFFASTVTLPTRFPCALKWLFDEMDSYWLANHHSRSSNRTSFSAVCCAKTEIMFQQFWSRLSDLTESLFDMEPNQVLRKNLQVIAQVLGSFSQQTVHLGNEASPHLLLFAKEVAQNSARITNFFKDIEDLPQMHEQDFLNFMDHLSSYHSSRFATHRAISEFIDLLKTYYPKLGFKCDGDFVDFLTTFENGQH